MDVITGGALIPGMTGFWLGGGRSSHTAIQEGRPVSQADLDATNRLQETSWQYDTNVLWTAQNAMDLGHPCMGFDSLNRPPMPEKMPDEEFAALDEDTKRQCRGKRREAREHIETWRSHLTTTAALLQVAQDDAEHQKLWMSWGHDSRLRRYPRVSGGANPQGSGLSRNLLRFGDGVALGDTGLYWLGVRLAGAAGLDKKTLDERHSWTTVNIESILASAADPLNVDFWWKDEKGKRRDDPWAVLATAYEIEGALMSDNPNEFLSHLPVNVDGTCNGLQHLSAMGLDPIGALATNLTKDPVRHDIYMTVAEAVAALVERDRGSSDLVEFKGAEGRPMAVSKGDLAAGWQDKISRDLVKRGTMTTPYGVTLRGMRDQLVEDGLVSKDDWGDAVGGAAIYMRDVMFAAIGQVVVAARDIMGWLQETAAALAAVNKPFVWVTPAGSTIRQSYHPWSTTRPLTAFGRIHMATTVDKSALKPKKQALAAAPNFVHSFDAAHMALTINAGASQGLTHWSMIHDSYGTHAARMGKLNGILRDEFVSIYQHDWLKETYELSRALAPGAILPPPPTRGSFDIHETALSRWFFA